MTSKLPKLLPLVALFVALMAGSALAQAGAGAGAGGNSGAAPDSSEHRPTGLDSLLQSIPPGELPEWPDSLPGGEQLPDSLLDEDDDRDGPGGGPEIPMQSLGVHPKFKSDTRSSDRRMDISNSLDLSVTYPTTWNMTGQIFYDRGLPRELSRETTEKGLSVSSSKRLMKRFPLSLDARRNRKLQEQNIGEDNYRRDEWDSSSLSAQTSGGWNLTDWLGINGRLNASANRSDTENNRGLSKSTTDGAKDFAARMDLKPGEIVSFTTGYSGARGTGTGKLLDLRDQLATRRDSLNVRTEVKRGTAFTLSFSGGRQESTSERLDFKRDEVNVVLPDSIPIKEETLLKDWGGNIDVTWKPGAFVDFNLGFSYREGEKRVSNNLTQDKDFAARMDLKPGEKDDRSEDLNFRMGLRPWTDQSIDVHLRDSQSFSGQYTSVKTTRLREAQFSSNQSFSKTLKLTLDAYFFLTQDYYANPIKNPQDRDQLKNRYTVTVKGKPFHWLTAENSLAYFLNRDIMIRESKSISNKDKTTLTWNSRLDYNFFERFSISQNMEVKVSKDDFIFTQDKNALDRESTLITSASLPLHGSIRLDVGHEFKLRQLGSFLPDPDVEGNPETFFLSRRVKKEDFRLGFSATLLKYLKFSIKESLGREVTYYYADDSEDKVPYGSLDTGIVYNREFGRAGSLRIDLQHQAKFGKFVREDQRSIWIPTLAIEYNF